MPDDLSPWIEQLWSVEWDRGSAPATTSSVISFPAMHATVEWGDDPVRHGQPLPAALVHGVVTEVFTVELSRRGGVVGARFLPDGFAFWSGLDASSFTDRVRPAREVLGPEYDQLPGRVLAASDRTGRMAVLVAALRRSVPRQRPDRRRRLVDLVQRMAQDETITRVEQLVQISGWTARTVQRRFRRDVGIGPKWVLTRFRLQQAALALEQDPAVDLAGLAVRLGWYDQAHLTNDFRRMLGETPGEYAARSRVGQPVG